MASGLASKESANSEGNAAGPGVDVVHPTSRSVIGAESIAVFALVRGGSSEGDYEMFFNSRECLREAMTGVQYDNIAFHEGNVPAAIQTILGRRM